MCTALSFGRFFGRTLDSEISYEREILITPRDFEFSFRNGKKLSHHYAMIGMGILENDFPLYFDATNEMGLSVAALRFPEKDIYKPFLKDKLNLASFEIIPFLLARCKSVDEAVNLFSDLNITDTAFSDKFAPSPLHFIIADKSDSVTLESGESGVKIIRNPVGILTNSPPFPVQLMNLSNYMNLSKKQPENTFLNSDNSHLYSNGLGAFSLPGDLSSMSRFVRCAFHKVNSESDDISQFFRILDSVSMIKGSVYTIDNLPEYTNYTSCVDTKKCIYYYKTYKNISVSAVALCDDDLAGTAIKRVPLAEDLSVDFY